MNRLPSAFNLLAELQRRGVELVADGEAIRFRPSRLVTPEDRARLLKHRPEVMTLLRSRDPFLEALCAGLPEVDALDFRLERAAIFEFEGGMARKDAEYLSGLAERAP